MKILCNILSQLPMGVLYVLSDVLFTIAYYVVGYRRKVVRKNLCNSFPDKTDEERRRIEKAFYHWFTDYIVETLKLLTATDEQVMEMIEFRGAEQIEERFRQGRPCAAMLGHYCNWEMLSCTALAMPSVMAEKDLSRRPVMGLIYHPLRNKTFNDVMISVREKHHGTCVPKRDILRHLLQLKQEERTSLFGYILDQSPKKENTHLWLEFMSQQTAVFTGAERIIRKMDNAVFYVDMERPHRGKYVCTFRLMTDTPQQLEEYELTRMAFRMLQQTIERQPELYLWSHNRWKLTK